MIRCTLLFNGKGNKIATINKVKYPDAVGRFVASL